MPSTDPQTSPQDSAPSPAGPRPVVAGRSPGAIALFAAAVVLTLAADLIVKQLAFARVAGQPVVLTADNAGDPMTIPDHEPVTLVPNVLDLKLTTNRGAVFGLGQGQRWVFIVVSVLAVGVIGRVFYRSEPRARGLHVCLALILAGALGNLYDRIMFAAVRDMLHLFPGVHLPFGWSWPGGARELYPWIFNIADAALVVGVLMMVVIMWRHDTRSRSAEQARS